MYRSNPHIFASMIDSLACDYDTRLGMTTPELYSNKLVGTAGSTPTLVGLVLPRRTTHWPTSHRPPKEQTTESHLGRPNAPSPHRPIAQTDRPTGVPEMPDVTGLDLELRALIRGCSFCLASFAWPIAAVAF